MTPIEPRDLARPGAGSSADPRVLLRDSVLEIRGDGKAGGGLVLAFQSLAALALRDPGLHVQEWPFFSSARRGANIRSFLRMSRRPIDVACEVTRPAIALLMDEAAGRSVDFAQGVPRGGTFVLNTRRGPEECARHYRLTGRVLTVPGDDIGTRHLRHAIGNVSAYVAMARAIGGFDRGEMIESFLGVLAKRRIPQALIDANREALDAFANTATSFTGTVTVALAAVLYFGLTAVEDKTATAQVQQIFLDWQDGPNNWQPPFFIPPFCATWHEISPVFCRTYHQDGFADNGDGVVSPCDFIILNGVTYHVDSAGPTVYLDCSGGGQTTLDRVKSTGLSTYLDSILVFSQSGPAETIANGTEERHVAFRRYFGEFRQRLRDPLLRCGLALLSRP